MKHVFTSSYGQAKETFKGSVKLSYCYQCFRYIEEEHKNDQDCQPNEPCAHDYVGDGAD